MASDYENLIAEITRLCKESDSTDCAQAVDDLCHGTIEVRIKEIKSSIGRVLASGLEQFYAEYARKLLRTYAEKLEFDRKQLEKLHSRIEEFLKDAQPSLDLAVDIFRFKDQINEALLFFTEKLWFLPDRGDRKQLDRWIYQMFRKWYDSEPLDKRLAEQFFKLDQLTLAIPSREFRQLFPENPPTMSAAVGECSLCTGEDPRRIRFCKSCSAENVMCYSCFYKHAWSRQHDEHRVFSELQNVPCPFCRREFSLGDEYIVFEDK